MYFTFLSCPWYRFDFPFPGGIMEEKMPFKNIKEAVQEGIPRQTVVVELGNNAQ